MSILEAVWLAVVEVLGPFVLFLLVLCAIGALWTLMLHLVRQSATADEEPRP